MLRASAARAHPAAGLGRRTQGGQRAMRERHQPGARLQVPRGRAQRHRERRGRGRCARDMQVQCPGCVCRHEKALRRSIGQSGLCSVGLATTSK